jgi:hypothetical protein
MGNCTVPNKCHTWEPWSLVEKGNIINQVSSTIVCMGGIIGRYIIQKRMCLECRFVEENVQKWEMDRENKMVPVTDNN